MRNSWPDLSATLAVSRRSPRSSGTRQCETRPPDRSSPRRLDEKAAALGRDLAARAASEAKDRAASSAELSLHDSCLISLRTDDPHLPVGDDGRALLWPNRGSLPSDARPVSPLHGPLKTSVAINGRSRVRTQV